jgi:N-acetylmuramoyl-L-alanine amidase
VTLSGSSDIAIVDRQLPWCGNLQRRELADVTAVVLHATETPDLETAWQTAMRSVSQEGVGVCGHLYIDRDGTCVRFVPLYRIANHVRGHNRHTIGIELVNAGRYPHHFDSRHQDPAEPFPERQMAALDRVLAWLRRTCPNLAALARHSDLDQDMVPASDDPRLRVRRRVDPGPRFPWEQVKAAWDEAAGADDARSPRDPEAT